MLHGDSGEFQWAMATLNVAHATGYPLFTMLGYLWLQIPVAAAAAWRLNLISAIFGAGTVAMVYVLSHAVTRRFDASIIGAIFLCLSPVFWFNSSILEVYTLNAFFLTLIIYGVYRWSKNPASNGPLYLSFFVLGLALAHHRMIVLFLPALFTYLLLSDYRFLFNWRRLILLAILMLPGIALYLYVPLRLIASGSSLHYAIFDIALGQEFSSSLFRQFDLRQVLWEIPVQNFQAGLILALLGSIAVFQRHRNLGILLVLTLLGDVAFGLAYWVPDVEVFLTPSFVVLATWIAMGSATLLEWLAAHLRPPYSHVFSYLTTGLLILLPFTGIFQYPTIASKVKAEAGGAEKRARAILSAGFPPGALLELDWETATAIRFIQATEGTRRDLEARLIKVGEKDEYDSMIENVDSGRPVFIEQGVKWSRAIAGYVVVDAPVELARLIREQRAIQTVSEPLDDHVRMSGWSSDDRSLIIYWKIDKPLDLDLASFVHFFDAAGTALGQQDHGPCCEAVYGYRTTEWEAGQVMADRFRPEPPNTWYVQIGMYSLNNSDISPYGHVIALQVKPVVPGEEANPLGIVFGNSLRARGYELSNDGKYLHLLIYWEALQGVSKDYTVFVHLIDGAGKILQQADHQPVNGVYPTGAWKVGQIVGDTIEVPTESGQAKLEFGLYDPADGQRLARADGSGDTALIDIK